MSLEICQPSLSLSVRCTYFLPLPLSLSLKLSLPSLLFDPLLLASLSFFFPDNVLPLSLPSLRRLLSRSLSASISQVCLLLPLCPEPLPVPGAARRNSRLAVVLVDGADSVSGNDGGVAREVNERGSCATGSNNFFVLPGSTLRTSCSFVGSNSTLFVDDPEAPRENSLSLLGRVGKDGWGLEGLKDDLIHTRYEVQTDLRRWKLLRFAFVLDSGTMLWQSCGSARRTIHGCIIFPPGSGRSSDTQSIGIVEFQV